MKIKIFIVMLITIFIGIFIIISYYDIENSMGSQSIQISMSFFFAAILEIISMMIFNYKKPRLLSFICFFLMTFCFTEMGKISRINQKRHVIYQNINKFESLFYNGKEIVSIKSDNIGSIWFLDENNTIFILQDTTKIKCFKDKCDSE